MALKHIDQDTVYPNGKRGLPGRATTTLINENSAETEQRLSELEGGSGGVSAAIEALEQEQAAIQTDLAGEAQARAALDTVLTARIDAEQTAREAADIAQMERIGRIPGKNRLINGNFDFFQDGSYRTFSNISAEVYGADQWIYAGLGLTGEYGMGLLPPGIIRDAKWHMGFRVDSAATAAWLGQKMEGARTLAGGKATASFWMRSGVTGKKVGVRLLQSFGVGGSPSPAVSIEGPVLNLTNVFKKYAVTFDVPSVAGKTFGVNDYLYLVFDINGSGYGGVLVGQTGLFEIAQGQFEEGEVATDFEVRPLATELVLCQWFFEKSYLIDVAPGSASGWGRVNTFYDRGGGGIVSTSDCRFKVTKRATPAVTVYDDQTGQKNNTSGNNGFLGTVNQLTSVGTTGFQINYTPATGSWGASFHFTADARL